MPCTGPTCKQVCDFLTLYMEGDLPPAQRESFDAHLAQCPPCREYMAQLRTVIELSKECMGCKKSPPPPPEDLIRAILHAVKDQCPPAPRDAGGKPPSPPTPPGS